MSVSLSLSLVFPRDIAYHHVILKDRSIVALKALDLGDERVSLKVTESA